jgi:hypothetical protein
MEAVESDLDFTAFLDTLSKNPTVIPDEVVDYYLKSSGFFTPEARMFVFILLVFLTSSPFHSL